MADKEEKVYLARLAEQADRYEEMVDHMKSIVKLGMGLTQEERNLLSVAYKNVVGTRRSSWRLVSNVELKEKEMSQLTIDYRKKIEKELQDICNDIFDLLDVHLIPTTTSETHSIENEEAGVFYYKMKADYLRYLAEFRTGNERKEAAENALVAYKQAEELSDELKSVHPIKLGLFLNFSVFYYEILNSPRRACHLAKQAFDSAMDEMGSLSEENYKDSTLILQLLRDNLTLWTSETQSEDAEKDDSARLQDVEDES